MATEKDTALELWTKAVDTQIHFNEMSHKARQLGISFALATLSVAVGIYSTKVFEFTNLTRGDVCGLLILISTFGICAVSFLELRLYQRLLMGAVLFGEILEKKGFSDNMPPDGCGMTGYISLSIGDRRSLSEINPRRLVSQWTIFAFYFAIVLGLVLAMRFFWLGQEQSRLPLGPTKSYWAASVMIAALMFFSRPSPPPQTHNKKSNERKGEGRHREAA